MGLRIIEGGSDGGNACAHCREPIHHDGQQWVESVRMVWYDAAERLAPYPPEGPDPYCLASPNYAHAPIAL